MTAFLSRLSSLTKLLFYTLSQRRVLFFFSFVFFETLFFAFQNGSDALTVLTFDDSLYAKVALFFSVLFDRENTFSPTTFYLLSVVALLQSASVVLFADYIRLQNSVRKGALQITGTSILALFGSSCAACSVALVSFLSSLGLTGISGAILSGPLILIVVVHLLLITLYSLLKKVENPFVC